MKPKINPLKAPSMAKSSVIKAKLLDQHGQVIEDDHMTPESPDKQPPMEMDEEGPDRQGPESIDLHMKKMANGGMLDPDHSGNLHNKAVDSEYGGGAEEDMQVEPAGLESDNDQIKPSDKEIMSGQAKMLARGGEVSPMDEEELEHHASIAAAIMAKMKAMKELHSDSDEDRMSMMAEGGEVDINENNMEQPNRYYKANEDEALDWDMDDEQLSDQPEDSNEHGDDREADEENEHDRSLVSKIMAKKKKKSPISA
jgi:hypothetical protein